MLLFFKCCVFFEAEHQMGRNLSSCSKLDTALVVLYLVTEEGRNSCRESRAVFRANRGVLIMHRTHPTGHAEVWRGTGGQRAHGG